MHTEERTYFAFSEQQMLPATENGLLRKTDLFDRQQYMVIQLVTEYIL